MTDAVMPEPTPGGTPGAGPEPATGAVDLALERGLRRRPSGEPPPLPKHLDRATVVWLAAAGLLMLLWLVLVSDQAVARHIAIVENNLVIWVFHHRVGSLDGPLTAIYDFLYTWTVPIVGWSAMVVMVLYKRWRHLVVFLVSLLVVLLVNDIAANTIQRPRPFGVIILGRWQDWAQPAKPIAMATAVLVGAYCSLVPPGRWRAIVPTLSVVFLGVYGAVSVYLGGSHPSDVLTAVLVGGAIPLLLFRWFTPDSAFPIAYSRGGNSAHLDVGGARGAAIRQAVEEQLGITVLDVKPIGAEGSAGSTPIKLKVADPVTGEPRPDLFAKLLARSHLRSDRQYKLFRTLAYGRLEDESRFQTVRRLVQQEDYLGLRFAAAGINLPTTHGIVEITPEAEYLLVTDFLEGYGEIGDAEVDVAVVDNALQIVRRMWDTGLAHRDVKPANLMTKGDEVAVIDVGFSQVRPTAWRQAIDLANMMLVLALRTTPELVYERARRLFTEHDIAEAFAATHSITVPTQLRQHLKADGRDLIGAFRAMAPPRPPIRIQRWSARRILLAIGVVAGGLLLLLLVIANLQATGLIPS